MTLKRSDLKVGDKLALRKDLRCGLYGHCNAVSEMVEFSKHHEYITIKRFSDQGENFLVKENDLWWSVEMCTGRYDPCKHNGDKKVVKIFGKEFSLCCKCGEKL